MAESRTAQTVMPRPEISGRGLLGVLSAAAREQPWSNPLILLLAIGTAALGVLALFAPIRKRRLLSSGGEISYGRLPHSPNGSADRLIRSIELPHFYPALHPTTVSSFSPKL